MKLKLKVLTVIGALGIIISITTYVYSRSALLEDYKQLEKRELVHDTQQVRNILRNMVSTIKLTTTDWAIWDDAYQFMEDKNEKFIKSNIGFTALSNIKINMMLFFDTKGKLFYGVNYDLEKKKEAPVPKDLVTYLESDKSFTLPTQVGEGKLGALKTAEGYVVLSAMPILNSEGKGSPRGTLVLGYFFNEAQILKLSEIAALQVHFFPLPLTSNDPALKGAYTALTKGVEYYISPVSRHLAYGYMFVYDLNHKPLGIIQVTSARDIYNQGIKTINRYLLIIASIAILFLLSIWQLLKYFILDRIISVSDQVTDIYSGSKYTKHIHLEGKDEMNHMVSAINALMDIIHLSQEQLKYRISLRTDELGKISHLNKNLLTEIDHQKETETKLRNEEKILRHLAYYDIITDLPNRIYFNELFHQVIIQSARSDERFAVLFIDVDNFKQINDNFGHDIGDKLLKHTANQLKKSIRENDIVARLAGDEFIIVLKHLHKKALITNLTEKMLQLLSAPLLVDDHVIRASYSIGISIYPDDGSNAESLQKHADIAMYYAKKLQGNIYCYYDETKNPTTA